MTYKTEYEIVFAPNTQKLYEEMNKLSKEGFLICNNLVVVDLLPTATSTERTEQQKSAFAFIQQMSKVTEVNAPVETNEDIIGSNPNEEV